MADTHSDIIKARAQNIANLTDDAVTKFTGDILASAAGKMEERLGYQAYGNYVKMFTENLYTSSTEYHLLADGQKKLRNLETAESYYALYFLALALKEIDEGPVMSTSITFGEGQISPSPIGQLIDMKDQYKRAGDRITARYGSGGLSASVV